MKENLVDIIIPAYNAHDTLTRAINSILMQGINYDINVIVVNDASTNGDYSNIINNFSHYINIKEYTLKENVGAGLARQYGIEHSDSEYIVFVDADDMLSYSVSIELLRNKISSDPALQLVSGNYLTIWKENKTFHKMTKNLITVYGKIYRRNFIEKYNIKFNNTRSNEDSGFNRWVEILCNNEMEQIDYISDLVYFNIINMNSIMIKDEYNMRFGQGFLDLVENIIYAINHSKEYKPDNPKRNKIILSSLINLYYDFIEASVRGKKEYLDKNWEALKKFYKSCYKGTDISEEDFKDTYYEISKNLVPTTKTFGALAYMGINEFINKLESET